MKRIRSIFILPVHVALICAFLALSISSAHGGDLPQAFSPFGLRSDVQGLPNALHMNDIARYRKIHALQVDGYWDDAQQEIEMLTDDRLKGHVLAQKYLHPTKYRSQYTELTNWMEQYADHPQARRIYKLALKRKPKTGEPPRTPFNYSQYGLTTIGGFSPAPIPTKQLSSSKRQQARALSSQVRDRLRRGWPTGAASMISGRLARALYSDAEFDKLLTDIATGYYLANKDDLALEFAHRATRSGDLVPTSYWWAGLSAFRLGNMALAHFYFAGLAQSTNASSWEISAGAYWAARAAFLGRRPEEVNRLLYIGSSHPQTFYGLLSRRALALDLNFDWAVPPLGTNEIMILHATPRGRRAMALLQIGLREEAEQELLNLVRAKPSMIGPVVALTSRQEMPSLTLRLAWAMHGPAPATLYPTTEWVPKNSDIDRALVHAIMRRESAFDTRAKSRAGARGLMQLMPSTASYVGGELSLSGAKRDNLYDPKLNVGLSLKYIRQLLDSKVVENDLFRLATAYNAGPGNLNQWDSMIDYRDDALLFIESLPAQETRTFIEHVLANLWIYRHQLNQPTPTLDAIAAGGWPLYVELDGPVQTAQKHVPD